MKTPVMLSIRCRQTYPEQEPETIELITEGTIEATNGGWDICYEESELTGLLGTTTIFRLEPGQVTLRRTGTLQSEMIFREGVAHDSLYRMDFGALLLSVCAQRIAVAVDRQGGTVELVYSISVEQGDAGLVEYHLDIREK